MAKFLYINYDDREKGVVGMTSGELTPIYKAVIPVLAQLVDDVDYVDKSEIDYLTTGTVNLDELSIEHLMIAYRTIMNIDKLPPALKDKIRQAVETDERFKAEETV